MNDIGFKIEEPLVDRETIEAGLEKCHDAIMKVENGGLEHFSWPLLRSNIADAVAQSASGDKMHWLFEGWAFAKELQSYKDPKKYPPDETAVLKLGQHELSGDLHPVVTISCEGAVIARLPFDVNLTAELNAVSISIKAGHIIACGGGDGHVTLSLGFRDVDLTGPVSLKTFQLPGKLEFANPIAIP